MYSLRDIGFKQGSGQCQVKSIRYGCKWSFYGFDAESATVIKPSVMGTLVSSGYSDKGARFICQMLAPRSVRQMGWALVGQRKENTGRCRKIMIHVELRAGKAD